LASTTLMLCIPPTSFFLRAMCVSQRPSSLKGSPMFFRRRTRSSEAPATDKAPGACLPRSPTPRRP
jgi:hypothetical protein